MRAFADRLRDRSRQFGGAVLRLARRDEASMEREQARLRHELPLLVQRQNQVMQELEALKARLNAMDEARRLARMLVWLGIKLTTLANRLDEAGVKP